MAVWSSRVNVGHYESAAGTNNAQVVPADIAADAAPRLSLVVNKIQEKYMQFKSKWPIKFTLALAISSILLQSQAWAIDVEVPLNYENAWKRTVQAIALEGIDLTTNDKESGVIQGTKISDKYSKYFTCPKLNGRAKSYILKLTATVSEKDELLSIVSVRVEGIRQSYQNKHFTFIPVGRIHTETACASTGILEDEILNKVSQK